MIPYAPQHHLSLQAKPNYHAYSMDIHILSMKIIKAIVMDQNFNKYFFRSHTKWRPITNHFNSAIFYKIITLLAQVAPWR